MKRNYILIGFLFIGFAADAQSGNGSKQASPPRTITNVTPFSYESAIVQGKLNLNKTFNREQNGTDYTLSYNLTASSENSNPFNNGKPLEIKLTKDFFDGVFLKASADIAGRSSLLAKFVQEKNILLTGEKGWISVISYYNDLR